MGFFLGFLTFWFFTGLPYLFDKKNILRKKCIFFRESHGFVFARGTVVLSRESRPCLSETKKKRVFCFFSFARVTVLLSREARLCFRESHGRASRKGKNKTRFLFFFFRESHGFASARGTGVLSRESRSCLFGNGKKCVFSSFFPSARVTVLLPREARL